MTAADRPSWQRRWLQIAAIAVAYALMGRLGQTLGIPPTNATAVWPPTGIALAAVLLFGARAWPAVWIGSMFVNGTPPLQAWLSPTAWLTPLCIAVGPVLEALAGAEALRRFGDRRDPFGQVRSAVVFILVSALLCSILSAMIGVGILYLAGYLPRAALFVTFWTWWQGDVAGALVVAPFLITWARERPSLADLRQALARPLWIPELILLLGLATGLAWISFGVGHPVGFLLIPLLIWALVRLGPRVATILLVVISGLAIYTSIWGIARGTGFFAGTERSVSLLLLHAFIDAAAATMIMLMAVTAERARAEAALAEHSQALEARVTERTRELAREVEERKRAEMELAEHGRSLEEKVRERTAELHQINEQLEAKVAERTAELRDKLAVIEQQQETLLLLSTPVLKLWEGVLALPLIGMIDARRAAQIMEGSLVALSQQRARIFIIDITGTPFVDAEVADYLMRTARAARLLGVECMLVGISPRVAQVLVQLGMDLSEVGKTYSTLESGLLDALRRMRYRVERASAPTSLSPGDR